MGECADMVLDGYLDRDGSYSGNNYTKYHKRKDTEARKQFWTIKRELSAMVKELIATGMNENGAVNQARCEINKIYGHEWRNLQYH